MLVWWRALCSKRYCHCLSAANKFTAYWSPAVCEPFSSFLLPVTFPAQHLPKVSWHGCACAPSFIFKCLTSRHVWETPQRNSNHTFLTVHFINSEWRLCNACLETSYFPEDHTGENIMEWKNFSSLGISMKRNRRVWQRIVGQMLRKLSNWMTGWGCRALGIVFTMPSVCSLLHIWCLI